jgi:hypothetical protein
MVMDNDTRMARVNDILIQARDLYQISDNSEKIRQLKRIEQSCYQIGEYNLSNSISYQSELWKSNNTNVHPGAIYKFCYKMLVLKGR